MQVPSLESGKELWQGSYFGRSCRVFDGHMGQGPSFHVPLSALRRSVAQVLILQSCTYSEGGKKKSQIVLMHQCAKCSSGHVSTGLRESAPVIINDLTGREVNVRYTSMLCAGLDRQWLFKKSLCFCVGAGSAHPNSA